MALRKWSQVEQLLSPTSTTKICVIDEADPENKLISVLDLFNAYSYSLTKEAIEAVLTGNILSHTHDQYLTAITKQMVEAVLTGEISSHTHDVTSITNAVSTTDLTNHALDPSHLTIEQQTILGDLILGNGLLTPEQEAILALVTLVDGDIHIATDVVVEGNVTAFNIGGSAPINYEMLTDWGDYDVGMTDWVVSAPLLYGLYTDIADIYVQLATKVPDTREILPGIGISGGGTLDNDVTISLNISGLSTEPIQSTDYVPFYRPGDTQYRSLISDFPFVLETVGVYTPIYSNPNSLLGGGLSGGGQLSTNLYLELDVPNLLAHSGAVENNVDYLIIYDNSASTHKKIPVGDLPYSTAITWGNIGGTISNQTDLWNILQGKASNTVEIIAGEGLFGGGFLDEDVTIELNLGGLVVDTLLGTDYLPFYRSGGWQYRAQASDLADLLSDFLGWNFQSLDSADQQIGTYLVDSGGTASLKEGTNVTLSQTNGVITISVDTTETVYTAGTGISITSFVINHSNSVSAQAVQGIYPITIDAQGHIDSYGTIVTTLPNPNALTIKFDSGTSEGVDLYTYTGSAAKTIDIQGNTGITIVESTGVIQIRHVDTSSVADVTQSANYFISALTFDTYGHVLTRSVDTINFNVSGNYAFLSIEIATDSGYTWGTVNTNITQTAESATDVFTLVNGTKINLYANNVAGTDAVKIEHQTTVRSDTTSSTGSGVFTVVDSVTTDSTGHITAINVKTVTVPTGNMWYTFTDGTNNAVPDAAQDTFTFAAGQVDTTAGLTVVVDAALDKVTYYHADTSSVTNLSGSANTFITGQTYDTYGHVLTRTTGSVDFTVSGNYAFQTIAIGTDVGHTWGSANVNTNQVADSSSDTFTLVNGTGINLYTDTVAAVDSVKIEHADTSTLSGGYGSTGIAAMSVDGLGHVTAITTATYLTSQSNDFGIVKIDNTDVEYTWIIADGTTTTADTAADTLTIVASKTGATYGIQVRIDSPNDAIGIAHADTSSLSGAQGGTGIASITVDEMGHITAITTATYISTESSGFGTVAIGADSGYTWGTSNQVSDVAGDTITLVYGTGISLSSSTVAATDAVRISHSDTSALSGAYGTSGISSITVDGLGHVTAISTATYLTSSTQSLDFGIFAIGSDSGYTWGTVNVNTNQTADSNGDTLTIVRGLTGGTAGIDLYTNTIAGTDAIKIAHADTSALSGVQGSAGIASITIDGMGHVTAVSTATYLTSNQSITLSGEASGSGTTSISVTLSNSAVIGKVLTGFTPTSGTITSTDSILTSIQKLAYDQHPPVTLGTANGLSLNGQQLSLSLASGSTTGSLSSTDWNTFNNKVSSQWIDSAYGIYYSAGNVGVGASAAQFVRFATTSANSGYFAATFANTSSTGKGISASAGSDSTHEVIYGSDYLANSLFSLFANGRLQFHKYGVNAFAGTPTYYLGVTATGLVVETSSVGYTWGEGLDNTGSTVNLALEELITSIPNSDNNNYIPWVYSVNGSHYKVGLFNLATQAYWNAAYLRGYPIWGGMVPNNLDVLYYDGVNFRWTSGPVSGASKWTDGANGIYRNGRVGIGADPLSYTQFYSTINQSANWAGWLQNTHVDGSGVKIRGASGPTNNALYVVDYNDNALFSILGNGKARLAKYGVYTYGGTPAYALGVDASGNIVEFAPGGGGTTTYSLTMNNSGSGDASGTTFNGSVARTLSYNTLGAAGLAASNTFTGTTQYIQGASPYWAIYNTNGSSAGGGFKIYDETFATQYTFGYNNLTNEGYIWNTNNYPFKIGIANIEVLRLFGTGYLRLNMYGSGTFTGTPAKYLAVDASGYVIETTGGGSYNGWNLAVNDVVQAEINNAENVNFKAGTGITLAYSATNNTVTITNNGGGAYNWILQTDSVDRGTIDSGERVNLVAGAGMSLSYGATNNTVTITSLWTDAGTNTYRTDTADNVLVGTTTNSFGSKFQSSATSANQWGIHATGNGTGHGVYALTSGSGAGVYGVSTSGYGVRGSSSTGIGIVAESGDEISLLASRSGGTSSSINEVLRVTHYHNSAQVGVGPSQVFYAPTTSIGVAGWCGSFSFPTLNVTEGQVKSNFVLKIVQTAGAGTYDATFYTGGNGNIPGGTFEVPEYKVTSLVSAPAINGTGVAGEIRFASDGIYVCISTNTWRKATLSTY